MRSTIQHIFGFTFTMVTIFLAAACSEFATEDFDSSNITEDVYDKISEYTQNFTYRYGKMDPEHSWGFGELAPEGSKGIKGTRAIALGENVENNQWIKGIPSKSDQNKYIDYGGNPDLGMESVTIPGFPSPVNGWYYTANAIYKSKESLMASVNNAQTIMTLGDVTDEEIIYVSNWFRENKNPKTEEINLTEFFVQEISKDKDRESYPNGAQKTYGTNLDFLRAVQASGAQTHINNFNSGGTNAVPNAIPEDQKSWLPSGNDGMGFYKDWWGKNRRITFMRHQENWSGGIEDKTNVTSFIVHSSDDSETNIDYVLVHLKFDGPISGKPYSGYYLAFDYSCKRNTIVERDGYYSNWIVKISPAYPTTTPDPDPDPEPETVTTKTVRVMCEDLGSTNDFDFNDLVFDVCYTYEKDAAGNKSNIQAHITLQAVGGTLPIYIGTDMSDPTKELHYRMTGTYAKNPINVGAGTTCAPVTFTVPATSTDPDDIDICVGNSANKGPKNIILPKSGKGKSFAPQKICVPTTVRWLKESQQIEWGYRIFYNWVRDEDLKPLFWEAEIEKSYLY